MKESRREKLLNRRKDLQVRIARERALTSLSEVLAQLDSHSALYEVLWQDQYQASIWIEKLFPVANYGRVDWGQLPKATCQSWRTDEERFNLVNYYLKSYTRNFESNIVIAWLSDKPAIRVKVGDAYSCLTEILEVEWETWIYDPESNWLIESYHEGEVCCGRSYTGLE